MCLFCLLIDFIPSDIVLYYLSIYTFQSRWRSNAMPVGEIPDVIENPARFLPCLSFLCFPQWETRKTSELENQCFSLFKKSRTKWVPTPPPKKSQQIIKVSWDSKTSTWWQKVFVLACGLTLWLAQWKQAHLHYCHCFLASGERTWWPCKNCQSTSRLEYLQCYIQPFLLNCL